MSYILGPTIHLVRPNDNDFSGNGFIAMCGCDRATETLSYDKDEVTCQCCLGNHVWTGRQSNSPSELDDYVEYCEVCGIENQGSFVE